MAECNSDMKDLLLEWGARKLTEAGLEFDSIVSVECLMTDRSECTKGCCLKEMAAGMGINYRLNGAWMDHWVADADEMDMAWLANFVKEVMNEVKPTDVADSKKKLEELV